MSKDEKRINRISHNFYEGNLWSDILDAFKKKQGRKVVEIIIGHVLLGEEHEGSGKILAYFIDERKKGLSLNNTYLPDLANRYIKAKDLKGCEVREIPFIKKKGKFFPILIGDAKIYGCREVEYIELQNAVISSDDIKIRFFQEHKSRYSRNWFQRLVCLICRIK